MWLAERLIEAEENEEAVVILLSVAQDESMAITIRERALSTLIEFGPGNNTIDALLSIIVDDEKLSDSVRYHISEVLSENDNSHMVVDLLSHLISEEAIRTQLRRLAAQTMVGLGYIEETLITLNSLGHSNIKKELLYIDIAKLLVKLNKKNNIDDIIINLVNIIKENRGKIRYQAVRALANLKQSNPDGLEILRKMLDVKNEPYAKKTREAAQKALLQIEG